MGTNYYWQRDVCPHCGRADESIHIGKSSGGWCFSLHVYPNAENDEGTYIESLDDWKVMFATANSNIRDEYGDIIEPERMLAIITERSWERKWDKKLMKKWGYESEEDWYRQNSAEPGPNGLSRHRIERDTVDGYYGTGCIAHGEGTWDLLVGDYS